MVDKEKVKNATQYQFFNDHCAIQGKDKNCYTKIRVVVFAARRHAYGS